MSNILLNTVGKIFIWIFSISSPEIHEIQNDMIWQVDPFDPLESSLFIDAVFTDIPVGIITDLCLVESGCKLVSIHRVERQKVRQLGLNAWNNAIAARKIDTSCIWHMLGNPKRWSTRGSHGQIAAYAIAEFGCVPPEILDIPFISALRAALYVRKICNKRRARGKSCTSNDIRIKWAGANKKRTEVLSRWRTRTHRARGNKPMTRSLCTWNKC